MTIKIIKNRSDIGAGTRGSDMGIDAMEIAAINQNNHYFNKYDHLDVETCNESVYEKKVLNFSKRISQVHKQCTRVCNAVKATLQDGQFPIVLSGDHSSALGTMSGVKAAHPDKRLGVIWIDAHADLHSPYTSPSGNIHGMPLAAALNEDNLGCQINELNEDTESLWSALKSIGVKGPKLLSEDLVYFGVRSTETPEDKLIKEQSIRNYKVAEVRYRTVNTCVEEALDQLKQCDHIYISFDVDSLDCDMVSYGTGTPVPKGFDTPEVLELIGQLIASTKVSCLEFVEINPTLDNHGNKMAEEAFKVLDMMTVELEKCMQ